MEKKEAESEKDRRRFSVEKAGHLWMSDVMHGPTVITEGKRKRKTYLIAFIDDATRVVPYAVFAMSENTNAFIPVFKQAILRRGVPKRLYVDNGAAFRSHHLELVCAKLGVTLIHTRPRDAAAKGKIERWFRTVRMQLLPILSEKDLSSLENLNRRLWGYVEAEYHNTIHKSLEGDTPLDRWAKASDDVRYSDHKEDFEDLFLFEAKRKVQKDRTVSLDGLLYEVDAMLVRETILLRFDPTKNRTVQVWHQGRFVQNATGVDPLANAYSKRNRPKTGLDFSALESKEEK